MRNSVQAAGYEVVGDFVLPDIAWWQHDCPPLSAKRPGLRDEYVDDPAALAIVEMTATEIDMRRRFGETCGYAVVVGRVV